MEYQPVWRTSSTLKVLSSTQGKKTLAILLKRARKEIQNFFEEERKTVFFSRQIEVLFENLTSTTMRRTQVAS
jgi:hypothetical protein